MSANKPVHQADSVENVEQGFNDSELMDIMAEIESLEKEFVGPDAKTTSTSLAIAQDEVATTNLQASIDDEIAMQKMMDETEMVAPEEIAEVKEEGNVTFLRPVAAAVATTAPAASKNAPLEMTLSGQMALGLNFKIGETNALLEVNGNEGLTLKLNGVELCINEESGCTISMAGGVTFNVPLTQTTAAKKAA
jgi:hypothetical protein